MVARLAPTVALLSVVRPVVRPVRSEAIPRRVPALLGATTRRALPLVAPCPLVFALHLGHDP
jgi:hypothetical protein